MILLADSEGPDQTARMRRLIWAFAVGTFSLGTAHMIARHFLLKLGNVIKLGSYEMYQGEFTPNCVTTRVFGKGGYCSDLSRMSNRILHNVCSAKTQISLRICAG